MNNRNSCNQNRMPVRTDFGPDPFVTNIRRASLENCNFRTALWTGKHLQVTLMCIPPRGEIGLEIHPDTDQFLCIEDGCGCVMMGCSRDRLDYQVNINRDCAVCVPAGTWHNIVNTGRCPLKLYSIYAPPHHPHGTVQRTKAEADAAEGNCSCHRHMDMEHRMDMDHHMDRDRHMDRDHHMDRDCHMDRDHHMNRECHMDREFD